MFHRSFHVLMAVALAALIQFAAMAREGGTSQIRGLPEHALAALPESVEIALLLDKAAQLRTTESGQRLFKFVSSTGLIKQLEESWPTLAKDLDFPPDEAFDELLGRRAIIASRGTFSGKGSQWVLITHVTAEVEKSLRDRLKPAARGLVNGFPILAIGGGRYELATSTSSTDDENAEKLSTVILAPTGGALFDEVLKSLATKAPVEEVALPIPKLKGRVDAMLMLRNPQTSRRSVYAATIGMQTWSLDFAADNTKGTPVATLPDAAVRNMLANPACFIAAMAHGDGKSLSGFGMIDEILLSLIPLDAPTREAFANGAALSISPGNSVSWAMASEESASAAVTADRAMSTLFAAVDHAGPSFHGEAPSAVRTMRTSLAITNPIAKLMDPDVNLQWGIHTAADGRTWWSGLCSSTKATPSPGLSYPTNCVYYFYIKPEAALTVLGTEKLLETPPLSVLKQIKLIQFSASADPTRSPSFCTGSGRIELNP